MLKGYWRSLALFITAFLLSSFLYAQPGEITDVVAASTAEGNAELTWTAPDPGDGQSAPSSYLVKFATSEIRNADLYALWVSTYIQDWTGLAPKTTVESRTLTGLTPGATLYFAVAAKDQFNVCGPWHSVSDPGNYNPNAYTLIYDSAPQPVAGLAVATTAQMIDLSWQANSEIDLRKYCIERSSLSAIAGFNAIASVLSPATTHQDRYQLVAGNTYYYRVFAEDKTGHTGDYSSVQSIYILAAPVFNASCSAAYSTTTLNWSWNPSNNAEGYRVISASSGVSLSGDLAPSVTAWLQSSLTPNTSAAAYVQAFIGTQTANSATATLFTLANLPGTVVSTATTSSIELGWDNNGNSPSTRYSVQWSTNGFATVNTPLSLAPSVTVQVLNLREGGAYSFKIWATNGDGRDTALVQPVLMTLNIPPSPPVLISAVTGTNDGDIVLTWGASGDDGVTGQCTSYLIKWATYTITSTNFGSLPLSSSTLVAASTPYGYLEPSKLMTNFYPGTTFWFALKALDKGWNYSVMSGTLSVASKDTPPQMPTGVIATPLNSSTVDIDWILPSYSGFDDRDLYKIYRATFPFSSYQASVTTFTVSHPNTHFRNTGLPAETTYYYRVSCIDKGDQGNGLDSIPLESPLSNLTSARTPDETIPAAPPNVAAVTGAIEGKINLSWQSPGDDDMSGPIIGGRFRIDYSTDPLKTFLVNSYKVELPTTTFPGDNNQLVITGLNAGVTYYFHIWAADETLNWSPASLGAGAWAQYDVTPPAAAGSAAAAGAWRRVSLSWTSPGDDNVSGTLNGTYEIRTSTIDALDTELKWGAVPDGYPCRIIITTSAAQGTLQSAVITGLTNGTTCFIALRSIDERGNISPIVSLSTAPFNTPPGNFDMTAPAFDSIAADGQPVMQWTAAGNSDAVYGDAISYTILYSTDSLFSSVTLVKTTQTAYSCDLRSFEDKTVYWKVWAVDVDSAVTASETAYFKVKINVINSAPGAFDLVTPSQGSIMPTQTPILSWNAASDIDPGDKVSYQVDYSIDAAFTSFSSSAGITGVSYTPPSLTENRFYWWRVWANDDKVKTLCATTFYFGVDAVDEPPESFDLSSPADTSVIPSTTVTFAWATAGDPDLNDTVTYEFAWSPYADFAASTTVTGLAVTSTTIAGLAENGIYYWRVTALDSKGLRRSSRETRRCYIDAVKELPGDFELIEPANHLVISTTTMPLFTWSKSIDPDPADDVRYIIDISPNPNFTGLGTTAVDRGADRYYMPLIGLVDQTTYYWRIRASGYQGNPMPQQVDNGFKFSTTTGTFVIAMTNTQPNGFTLIEPANGSVKNTKQVKFTWSPAVDSDIGASVYYALSVSTAPDFSVITASTGYIAALEYEPDIVFYENRTYYWTVRAVDNGGAITDCISTFTFTVPVLNTPQPPSAVQGTLANDKERFTLNWAPVARNGDGTAIDDLAAYRIYRGLSVANMRFFVQVPPDTGQWSDNSIEGGNFYYRVTAIDSSGVESALEEAPVLCSLSPSGLQMVSEDQSLTVEVPPALSRRLLAENNTYGQNLRFKMEHETSAENNHIIASYRLKVLNEAGAELKDFSFGEAIVLTFSYNEGSGAQKRLAQFRAAAGTAGTGFNVFWNNGLEYIRIGGSNNDAEKKVTLRVTRPGEYQLRAVARATVFALSGMNPRKVFTPGIAPYEKISFYVDNPQNDKVIGRIFNLRGESVAEMTSVGDATAASVVLEWDGRESGGISAPKGVYIYQIKGSGKVINGTVIVAR
jgi:fibronectin type 3 domain-containing protein